MFPGINIYIFLICRKLLDASFDLLLLIDKYILEQIPYQFVSYMQKISIVQINPNINVDLFSELLV